MYADPSDQNVCPSGKHKKIYLKFIQAVKYQNLCSPLLTFGDHMSLNINVPVLNESKPCGPLCFCRQQQGGNLDPQFEAISLRFDSNLVETHSLGATWSRLSAVRLKEGIDWCTETLDRGRFGKSPDFLRDFFFETFPKMATTFVVVSDAEVSTHKKKGRQGNYYI